VGFVRLKAQNDPGSSGLEGLGVSKKGQILPDCDFSQEVARVGYTVGVSFLRTDYLAS